MNQEYESGVRRTGPGDDDRRVSASFPNRAGVGLALLLVALVTLAALVGSAWIDWGGGSERGEVSGPSGLNGGKELVGRSDSASGDERDEEVVREKMVGFESLVILGRVDGTDGPMAGVKLVLRWYRNGTGVGAAEASHPVTTDARGEFEWIGSRRDVASTLVVASGQSDLIVRCAPKYVMPEDVSATVLATGIRLSCQLQGTVKDEEGRPIHGASIAVNGAGVVRTDRKGQFSMLIPSGRSSRVLIAFAAGFTQKVHRNQISGGTRRKHIEITLQRGARITGVVVDDVGNPVSDVKVRSRGLRHEVATDEKGRFELHGAATGLRHSLDARKAGFAPGRARGKAGGETVTIELSRGTSLRVLARERGGGCVPGARIQIVVGSSGYRHRGFTDAKGAFLIEDLERGPIVVVVSKDGYAGVKQEVRVADDGSDLTVRMERRSGTLSVKGRVVDEAGLPIAGATINYGLAACTDVEGRFEVRNLRRGVRVISAYKPGFRRAIVRANAGRGGEVVLRMRRAPELMGRVVDASSREPVSSFEITVYEDARKSRGRLLAIGPVEFQAPDGKWLLNHWMMEQDRKLYLQVSARGYASKRVVVWPRIGSAPDDILLELEPGEVVEGIVRAEESAKVLAGVQVQLRVKGPDRDLDRVFRNVFLEATTDERGRFRFRNVPPGQAHLRLSRRDLPLTEFGPVTVSRGAGEVQVFPTIGAGYRLRGRVIGMPDAVGWTLIAKRGRERVAEVQPDLTFEFSGLEPGKYIVELIRPSGDYHWIVARIENADVSGAEFRSQSGTGAIRCEVRSLARGYVILSGPNGGRFFLFRGGKFQRGGLVPGHYRMSIRTMSMDTYDDRVLEVGDEESVVIVK